MPKASAIILILCCALLGGYAGNYLAFQHGFFAAIEDCIGNTSSLKKSRCILVRSSTPYRTVLTGVPVIDDAVAVLLEFFAVGLVQDHGSIDWQAVVGMVYMASQFGALWMFMTLEGLRKINHNNLGSWTGLFGMIGQLVTITVAGPIYLALSVFSSAKTVGYENIMVDTADLEVLSLTSVVTYFVPTFMMVLPALGVLSQRGNYFVIALWQPFPLYSSIVQPILKKALQASDWKPKETANELERSLRRVYRFIIALGAGVHIITLAIALASHLVPGMPTISAAKILLPTSLTDPPIAKLMEAPVSKSAQMQIVGNFLRWDIFCACASFVVWAAYQKSRANTTATVSQTILQVAFWTVVGGPLTPAAVLLRDRDMAIIKAKQVSHQTSKSQ